MSILRIHSLSLRERVGVRAGRHPIPHAKTLTPALSRGREREEVIRETPGV